MKKIILSIFLVLSMVTLSVKEGTEVKTRIQNKNILKEEIKENKAAIENIKKQYSIDLKEIENKYKEKENILKEKLIDIRNEKEQIKIEKNGLFLQLNILKWLATILGISSILYLYLLWKNIDKKIQNKVIEKVAEITSLEKSILKEVILKYKIELSLKNKKKICVLSADIEREDELRKVLFNFKKVDYEDIENSDNLNYNKYNIVLLNHNNKNITKENIENVVKKIKEKNKDTLFFYYGKEFLSKEIENINYCKSIFTLYGNLIDLLRTQDLLKK